MIQMTLAISHPDTLTASTMFGLQFVTCKSSADHSTPNLYSETTDSALVFHVWEWILGLPFEVKHIWKCDIILQTFILISEVLSNNVIFAI